MLPDGEPLVEATVPVLTRSAPVVPTVPALTCVYSGVWTQAIPEDLIRDPLLKAVEVRVWCVLRTYLKSPIEPVSPTYDALCRDGNMARATLARSLKVLRLTRWLTSRLQRDAIGLVRGATYILHDRRLDAASVMMLDPKYPAFVAESAIDGVDDRVRRVALLIAEQMPELYQALVPTVPELIQASVPLSSISELRDAKPPAAQATARTEARGGSSKTELRDSTGSSVLELPVVHPASSSGGSAFDASEKKKTTTTTARVDAGAEPWANNLHLPSCLKDPGLAIQFLAELPDSLRHLAQDILDELAGQYSAKKVDRPLAYLGGLIRKAKAGTFTVTEHTTNARRRRQREAEIAADLASFAADSGPGVHK